MRIAKYGIGVGGTRLSCVYIKIVNVQWLMRQPRFSSADRVGQKYGKPVNKCSNTPSLRLLNAF